MRTIRGQQVTLEPQTAEHAERMYALLSDPALYEHLDEDPPASAEWLRERFRKLETRQSPDGREKWLNWVIRDGAREPVGYVQATVRGTDADIAFVLSSARWGQGLAFDATDAMMDELAAQFGVTRFFATVDRGNRRSIRLLKRLGFHTVDAGLFPRRTVAEGDVLMTRAVAEDPP